MASNTSDVKYKFVTEPEADLLCVICLEVAEEPWQHHCGRLLCKKCLDRLGRDKPCPNCRKAMPQYFQDNRSKRAIQGLPVKCEYDKCEWVGTVGTLQKHLATCKFAPVPCPNRCEGKYFTRQSIDEHLANFCPYRKYLCKYCGEKGTYVHITQIHDAKCGKKLIRCPFCAKRMQRQHIEKHVAAECECTIVECKYKRLGCSSELTRKDMTTHVKNDQHHLHMAIETTLKLERSLEGALARTTWLENELEIKSARLEKALKDKTLQLEKEKGKIAKLEQALRGALDKISILENNYRSVLQSLELDKLHVHVVMDTISLLEKRHATLRNGEPLIFKVTNYQQRKENKSRFNSPAFYTCPGGYHMSIRVDIRSESETHISVYAQFLVGDHDDELNWPFIGDVTFKLLNQLKDENHFKMKLSIEAKKHIHAGGSTKFSSFGYRGFIPHSMLGHNPGKNTQYLKDDTLYFRVSVDVPTHKPWLECTEK